MKEKKPFIIEIILSIIFIIIGIIIRVEYYSTLFFAMGVGIMFSSFVFSIINVQNIRKNMRKRKK